MDARQCTVVFGNPKSSIRMHIMKGSSCRAAHARVRGGRPAPKALSQDNWIRFYYLRTRHYLRTYSVLRTKNMKHKACHYLRTKHFEKYLRTQNWSFCPEMMTATTMINYLRTFFLPLPNFSGQKFFLDFFRESWVSNIISGQKNAHFLLQDILNSGFLSQDNRTYLLLINK